ncbi:MAG: SEL1-like repeat protein [Alistipes sp.]|nr:SEL1-like repeat protein [Alistipes sp.]
MKRLFTLLILAFTLLTATAQAERSIILDQGSFSAVQSDALSGVNIDPIGVDMSRNACARVKIRFANMSRAEVDALEVKFRSNTDLTKQRVAEYYDNVLILEMTAKQNTRFYLFHPEFGESNEVTLSLEGNKEYQMEGRLNQSFSIVVNSNVEGAEVYIDNNLKGRTGANMSLTVKDVMIGDHTLKVVYGGVNSTQQITVNSGSIFFRQNVDTAAAKPQFVVFAVEPSSAVVIIDGKHYTLQEGAMRVVLNSGTYNYTVTAAGYHPQSGTFTIAGEKVVKSINLRADSATVTLTAPENAEIWINDEMKGTSRWSGTLASGTYIFEARKAGHRSTTLSKTISSAEPQQSYALPAPTPIYGSLMVDGSPLMADVTLDGKNIGQTPLLLDNIIVGEHTVVISKSGYSPKTQTITVTEGGTATVNATLTKQTLPTLKGAPITIDFSLTAGQLNSKGNKFYYAKDYNSAVQYYYAAAEQGNRKGQCNLGYCYEKGYGLGQDYTQAVYWYRKAAEQGLSRAQCNLGYCYENGYGVEKDYTQAVYWYRKAAELGNSTAQCNLGYCYEKGYGLGQDYTQAAYWYRKAAEQGLSRAQCNLGYCYDNGYGVEKDDTQAVYWYRKAAEQGNSTAQYNLGLCYEYGEGVTKDISEAKRWYQKAADQGYQKAKERLNKL